jgi:hypothetical protein
MRGADRESSRNARWDAVDAKLATDEREPSGRRRRVVPAPGSWRQVRGSYSSRGRWWQQSSAHQGDHVISRKPLRREGRVFSAGPVCSCAHFYVQIAHETAGAARIRLSLRLLVGEGGNEKQNSVASRREIANTYSLVIARLVRATQYAAASRLKLRRLWNTGSSGQAGR